MRYNDFKLVESKRLFEAANAGLEAQHAIHDIEAISDAVPTMDPQLKASIISNLQNLASKVGDFVAKNIKQTQPAQQPQPQAQPQRWVKEIYHIIDIIDIIAVVVDIGIVTNTITIGV